MGRGFTGAEALVVCPCPPRAPRWGDVLVYSVGEKWVAHRALRRFRRDGRTWWITKGDGHWTVDRWPVAEEEVLGIVTAYVRRGQLNQLTGWRETLRRSVAGLSGWYSLIRHPPIRPPPAASAGKNPWPKAPA